MQSPRKSRKPVPGAKCGRAVQMDELDPSPKSIDSPPYQASKVVSPVVPHCLCLLAKRTPYQSPCRAAGVNRWSDSHRLQPAPRSPKVSILQCRHHDDRNRLVSAGSFDRSQNSKTSISGSIRSRMIKWAQLRRLPRVLPDQRKPGPVPNHEPFQIGQDIVGAALIIDHQNSTRHAKNPKETTECDHFLCPVTSQRFGNHLSRTGPARQGDAHLRSVYFLRGQRNVDASRPVRSPIHPAQAITMLSPTIKPIRPSAGTSPRSISCALVSIRPSIRPVHFLTIMQGRARIG